MGKMGLRHTRPDMLLKVSQALGIEYKETFSPIANITLIRVLMQMAVQYDPDHQMDVKTVYLLQLTDEIRHK